MNKDKIEVLNTIAANNGHKDWLELTHCEGPITIMNCTIEAMELYAQTAQLQQHSVMQGLPTENDIRAQALLMENPYDSYATKIIARGAYESGARWAISKLSGSPTVGKAGEDASVSDGK
jgi:hypothetical protein